MARLPLLFITVVVVAMLVAVATASASASAYGVRAADEGLVIGADEDDVFGLGDMIARRRRLDDLISAPSPSTNAPSPSAAAVAPSPDDGSSFPSTSGDDAGNATTTTTTEHISYLALSRGSVPCSQRGASYYNCHPGAEAYPYTRGCSVITQCRG